MSSANIYLHALVFLGAMRGSGVTLFFTFRFLLALIRSNLPIRVT